MAFTSSQAFESIVMKLSVLRYVFASNAKQGRFSLNKDAESFFGSVLNIIHGWNLKNSNVSSVTAKAIDLADKTNRICVQVTSDNGSPKIKKTIKSFIEENMESDYDRLIVLIITSKRG
jgi:hypothetical protein